MHTFHLSASRVVVVNSFHISWTYDERFLVGGRDKKNNMKLVEEAAKALAPLWGDRPTHVVPPQVDSIYPGRLGPQIALPSLRYHAWLKSDPLDAARTGSELILVGFGDGTLAPFEYVAQLAQGLAWEELAQDWDY